MKNKLSFWAFQNFKHRHILYNVKVDYIIGSSVVPETI